MLDDLLDIVERLAASQFKNHLDINEGIFGMLEKHIEIKSPLKHLKEGESLPVVDINQPSNKIIDIGVESEGEDTVAVKSDNVIPVFNSTRK